jgi:uncharacterized protein (TIGR02588 family)
MTKKDEAESASEHEGAPDWLEKAATVIAGLLLTAIVGFLAWDGFHDNSPAALTAISAGMGEVRGESRYIPVTINNTGDEAVRDVGISVESTASGTKVESEFEIDWLPGRSKRDGVAVLPRDAVGPFKATVKGYVIP